MFRIKIFFLVLLIFLNGSCFGQDAETLEEAKLLHKEALDLKKSGKTDEAIKTFEKALRTNRSILEMDDEGLVEDLKKFYEGKLASSPEDIQTLETMGFISAVCFADFEKAIGYYKKLLELSKDEKVQTKTKNLIARLETQANLSKLQNTVGDSVKREEKVKEWNQLEKQDNLSLITERIRKREEKILELSRAKEELEARLPQMEDQLKDLQEGADKADLFYRTTSNAYYRRKRERLEGEAESKKQDILNQKRKLAEMTKEIEKLTKESDAEQAALSKMTGQSKPLPLIKKPEGEETGQEEEQESPETNQQSSPALPGDPALPPGNNPDFPSDNASSPTKWP